MIVLLKGYAYDHFCLLKDSVQRGN